MDLLKEIERDLRAFADPWSEIMIDNTSAVWERDGVEITATFAAAASGGFPDVVLRGRRTSYREFLASPDMANLNTFADSIAKTHPRQLGYIDTSARLVDDLLAEQSTDQAAIDLVIQHATDDLPFLSTRVVLVRGEAGSGKTVTLREATARQAAAFLQGKAQSLFFLVDAQGRALSRLEDAMAKDLQDLRARFSYAAVAPLTRHNLLIPIIDGFDELLGSGGYDEAFSSLAAFLATLDGQGSVVASARSAFFNYRDFYDNATRFSADGRLNYQVDTLNVEPWTKEQIRLYFDSFCQDRAIDRPLVRDALRDLEATFDEKNEALLSKPFYASRVAVLVATGATIRGDEDLLDQLVTSFVEREHRKLLDRDNTPLLSVKGHRAFLTALAEEMWWQENRRLDVGTVQAVAELITEQFGLPPAAAHAIVERVSSYAFLTSDASGRRSLRFEHEVFYGYFLAHKLHEYIDGEPGDLRRFIARSVVEPTLVEQVVRLLGTGMERCSRAVESISFVLRPTLSEIVARENAGVLISAILRAAGRAKDHLVIQNVVFQGLPLGPLHANDICFERCDFNAVDFSQVHFVRPEFISSALRNITIDLTTTRLDSLSATARDVIHGLTVRGEQSDVPTGKVFAPEDIVKVLVRIGMDPPHEEIGILRRSSEVEARIDVLERFVNKMARRFYASYEDIDRFPFAQGRPWKEVLALLNEHGLLEEHSVAKSGPPIPLVRLSVPPEIIRRGEDPTDPTVPASVRAFWVDLLSS